MESVTVNPYLRVECICGNLAICQFSNIKFNYFYCGLCERKWEVKKN